MWNMRSFFLNSENWLRYEAEGQGADGDQEVDRTLCS